ncbi:MAG: orotidine-5'-phosphate decarboxylase [bacterium]|nr:orotidine-5'-phosphate decarboxylase [bacterium]
MKVFEKFRLAIKKSNSLVCVGLDTDIKKIPQFLLKEKNPMLAFNKKIIEATSDIVSAYKLNSAFYESQGLAGIETLMETRKCIPSDVIAICDAKRGDIGNTSKMYAKAAFEIMGFDILTVNPYLGTDAVAPFLEYEDKGVFILCLTSNPGAYDFEIYGKEPIFKRVASFANEWNKKYGNCGLVVGATMSDFLSDIKGIAPELPWLVPGVGAQGGSVEDVIKHGGENLVINSSRNIIYASSEENFAEKAREEALKLKDEINRHRKNI